MLAKINRIRKKKDFETIFKNGTGFKNNLIILRMFKNGLAESRFGFIVSQKVSKKAVERNKIRRRLSEIIRENLADIKKGEDLVFISLPGMAKKGFAETKGAIEDIFKKAKLKKNV